MKTAKDLKIPFTWVERRTILLDRFLYIPSHLDYREESFPYFADSQPVVIEYCSGNGQWICDRAKQNRDLNWLAVEKRFERARQIWLRLHRENITNLCVICGEALTFTRFYAPEAQEIYVNFPDPWPKLRHAKHRLVRAEFLRELLRIVKLGGKATCATDHPDYAKEMEKEFAKCSDWKMVFNGNEWPDYGRSFFNDLWREKGRIINYLSYERL